jgi:hypothetical protein
VGDSKRKQRQGLETCHVSSPRYVSFFLFSCTLLTIIVLQLLLLPPQPDTTGATRGGSRSRVTHLEPQVFFHYHLFSLTNIYLDPQLRIGNSSRVSTPSAPFSTPRPFPSTTRFHRPGRPTQAHDSLRRPTIANAGQRRPAIPRHHHTKKWKQQQGAQGMVCMLVQTTSVVVWMQVNFLLLVFFYI